MKNATTSFSAGLLAVLCSTAQAGPVQSAASPHATTPGLEGFLSCRKEAADKPSVKFGFKPDSKLSDLIGFMSTLSCTPLIVPKGVNVDKNFNITESKNRVVTAKEMYRLFLSALDTNGLTVQPTASALRIVAK